MRYEWKKHGKAVFCCLTAATLILRAITPGVTVAFADSESAAETETESFSSDRTAEKKEMLREQTREAAAATRGKRVKVTSAEDLEELAKKCSVDVNSRHLLVVLTRDIDLTGRNFSPIPYFSGIFDGKGHTIRGITIRYEGSGQGLFRSVGEGAVIRNLNVEGSLEPAGSAVSIGGIAGSNAGTILNCSFHGTVRAKENGGGIVGVNKKSGTISACVFQGKVITEHRSGGIAGSNSGSILESDNLGEVNTEYIETNEETKTSLVADLTNLANLDVSSIKKEDVVDIMDIGGIAGYSEGFIGECGNIGTVGYAHSGYNVGGIVGRSSGYTVDCTNNGDVYGRKDVGGILGQLEPESIWEYSKGRAQELQGELKELNSLIDTLAQDTADSAEAIRGDVHAMSGYAGDAINDLQQITDEIGVDVEKTSNAVTEAMDQLESALDKKNAQALKTALSQLAQTIAGTDFFNLPVYVTVQSDTKSDLSAVLDAKEKNWWKKLDEYLNNREKESRITRNTSLQVSGSVSSQASAQGSEGTSGGTSGSSDEPATEASAGADAAAPQETQSAVEAAGADAAAPQETQSAMEAAGADAAAPQETQSAMEAAGVDEEALQEAPSVIEDAGEDEEVLQEAPSVIENSGEEEAVSDDAGLFGADESGEEEAVSDDAGLFGADESGEDEAWSDTPEGDMSYLLSDETEAEWDDVFDTGWGLTDEGWDDDSDTSWDDISDIGWDEDTDFGEDYTSLGLFDAEEDGWDEIEEDDWDDISQYEPDDEYFEEGAIIADEDAEIVPQDSVLTGSGEELSDEGEEAAILQDEESTTVLEADASATQDRTIQTSGGTNISSSKAKDVKVSVNTDLPDTSRLRSLLNEVLTDASSVLDPAALSNAAQILKELEIKAPDTTAFYRSFGNLAASVTPLADDASLLAGKASQDIDAITDQLDKIIDTFFNIADSISLDDQYKETDVSGQDPYQSDNSSAQNCRNIGTVRGDTNAGGITGCIGFESKLDKDGILDISEYLLKDARYNIFASVRQCYNSGLVQAKKESAGGIDGYMEFGIVTDSLNTGAVSVQEGDYCGGITGKSQGFVTDCCAGSLLSGGSYIGGIAGEGTDISNCISYSYINSQAEYLGAVAGRADGTVTLCRYVDYGIGGIDNIGYAGAAQPIEGGLVQTAAYVTQDGSTAQDEEQEVYDGNMCIVTFVVEDEIYDVITVPFGTGLEALPEVPNKGTDYWEWDEFDQEHIFSSQTVTGAYHRATTTLASEGDVPDYLVEGVFYEGQKLSVIDYTLEDTPFSTESLKDLIETKIHQEQDSVSTEEEETQDTASDTQGGAAEPGIPAQETETEAEADGSTLSKTKEKISQAREDIKRIITDQLTGPLLDAKILSVNDYDEDLTVRVKQSGGGRLFTAAPGEMLQEVSYTQDGSYIVFLLKNGGSFAYYESVRQNKDMRVRIAIACGIAAGVLLLVIFLTARRRKKRRNLIAAAETAEKE